MDDVTDDTDGIRLASGWISGRGTCDRSYWNDAAVGLR